MIERRLRYVGLCCQCFLLFVRGMTVWALSKKYQPHHHFLLKWESVYNCVRLSETAVLTLCVSSGEQKTQAGRFMASHKLPVNMNKDAQRRDENWKRNKSSACFSQISSLKSSSLSDFERDWAFSGKMLPSWNSSITHQQSLILFLNTQSDCFL